ncbi:restriction endonuclease [Streptomyces goshikiensis]|uniref:restriction endonuclease n=1 Tax=Streptomyces goshikiensis TaxID=1942 RepID=UPI0039171CE9
MGDQQFEYTARPLVRDGWAATKVGRDGARSADVIGVVVPHGRIVVQAKHTRVGGKVGSSVMYEVTGTAGPARRADHAVVVTNGSFTREAMTWGDRHGVHCIDRDRRDQCAHEGKPLHELLGLPAGGAPPALASSGMGRRACPTNENGWHSMSCATRSQARARSSGTH